MGEGGLPARSAVPHQAWPDPATAGPDRGRLRSGHAGSAPAAARRTTAALLLGAYAVLACTLSTPREPVVSSGLTVLRLDPNQASADELALLPGIGPHLAQRIVQTRQASGSNSPFQSLEDLGAVPGLGPRRLEALRSRLLFPDPAPRVARGKSP